jgi:hypothetical protein
MIAYGKARARTADEGNGEKENLHGYGSSSNSSIWAYCTWQYLADEESVFLYPRLDPDINQSALDLGHRQGFRLLVELW